MLTLCTKAWFQILSEAIPTLRTHFITLDLPPQIPESLRPQLQNRSMQVRKLRILPIEAIVRGYITGSAWKEYQKSGTVHGIKVAAGLKESEAFPDGPIYTYPSYGRRFWNGRKGAGHFHNGRPGHFGGGPRGKGSPGAIGMH